MLIGGHRVGALERQPGVVDAVQHVADDVAAQRRRRMGERPADQPDAHAALAEDLPQRLGGEGLGNVRLLAQEPVAHERLREDVVGQHVERRAVGRAPGSAPPSARRSSAAAGRWPRSSRPARPASAAASPGGVAAPVSSTRPKLGSRPSATASEMWSSDAPSTRDEHHAAPGHVGRSAPAAGASPARRGPVGAGPRSSSGTTSEQRHRRHEQHAARRRAPPADVGQRDDQAHPAADGRRQSPPASSAAPFPGARNGAKSLALSHSTVAPAAAAIVEVQASTRTLSQPGRQHLHGGHLAQHDERVERRPARWRRRRGRRRRPAAPTGAMPSGNSGLRCSVAISR